MSDTKSVPIEVSSRDEGEELQRAELYGLLAQLWLAPPEQAMFDQFRVAVTEAPTPGAFLEGPWQSLVAAVRNSSPAQASAEYSALFHAIGKPDVMLYASAHLAGALNERPLVDLRTELAQLDLSADPDAMDTEDHIAFLFEVMRYLIAGDDITVCNLERQRRFFRRFIQPWVESSLPDALMGHPKAQLYAALADFTRAFVQVEMQGFDMIE